MGIIFFGDQSSLQILNLLSTKIKPWKSSSQGFILPIIPYTLTVFPSAPSAAVQYLQQFPLFSLHQQALPGHLLRLLHPHQFNQGRNDIRQAAAFPKLIRRIGIYQNERNRVGGMSRPWLAGSVIHQLLRIAVIRADKHHAAYFLKGIHRFAHALVHRLDGLDSGFLHPGMANHVGVCKVNDNHIVFPGLNGSHQLLAHARSAHLRL